MEHNNEDVVTMQDLLDEENELHDQASAVLQGSDEKNCNGFSKRQALYSCLTCSPDVRDDFSKAIGICLACSLHCHDKHELVELYTKRNFHCDCGIKSGSVKCQLDLSKLPVGAGANEKKNKYNQNFAGLYCTCARPYPDPENPVEDEMIQCIACEDWYHSGHLNAKVPAQWAYAEMICGGCMEKYEFLKDYLGFTVTAVEKADESSTVDVSLTQSNAEADEDESPVKRARLTEPETCSRPKQKNLNYAKGSATFWKNVHWRKELCNCVLCLKIYEENGISFIKDIEDSTQCYEEKGKNKGEQQSSYAASLEALSTLPRVSQIDAITGYNRMKDKLFEFLQTFVQNNQIVTEEDIQRFFRTMKESNDQQPHVGQPHFCR